MNERLKKVASLVDGKSIIDVGCDHGYLSIYLTQRGIKCLATDISKFCIDKAKDNFLKYDVDIATKVTDGLNDIDVSMYDTIIISGMGAHTILKILDNKVLTDSLIISSNNNIEMLRREVVNLGYYIDDEVYVKENKQKYIIIRFKKGSKKYSDFEYLVGPILQYNLNYIEDLKGEYQSIINKIPALKDKKRNKYLNILNLLEKNND